MQGYYTRRAKQTINGLRRWAQTEAKKDPENADYYHKYAAEEAMSRLEDLDAYVRQYVSKVDDFQEMKALNRLWRQFIPETHYPARPEAKGVLDDVTASKVYQATGNPPRRKQGESRGAYEARRQKHQSNIDFARAYIREQKLSKKELRKILRKAAGRRGQNLAGDAFLARLRKLEGLLNK